MRGTGRVLFLLAIIFILATQTACSGDKLNSQGQDIQTVHNKIVLGFSQIGAESDWRKANSESIKSAALEEKIELLFMNAQQKQENQIKSIRSFIAQQVDVIAFSPIVETGWDSVLTEAKIAGIPVIIMDRAISLEDRSLYVTYIGSDFEEEGRKAGRWLLEKVKDEKGTINVVELQGTAGSTAEIGRQKGFAETIKANPNIKVIRSEAGDFMRSKGKEIMEKFLQIEGRKIDVVFSHNDDMALGAIEAIEEYGLKPGKDMKIISIDAVKAAFIAMKAGKLNCAVECNPLQGPALMQAVKDIIEKKQLPKRIIIEEGIFPADVAEKVYPSRKY